MKHSIYTGEFKKMLIDNCDEQIKIMMESRDALRKIRLKKKNTNKPVLESMSESFSKYDRGRTLYELFDVNIFEQKARMDILFYEQLLQKISDSDQTSKIQIIITDLLKTVKNIYEIIDVKPQVYGNHSFDLLSESIDTINNKLSKTIHSYINKNFYDLTVEQRMKRYGDKAKEIVSKVIVEDENDINEAIEFAIKSVIIENFLTNVSFPFAIWSRIDYLMESELYNLAFDQEKLFNLVNEFKTKNSNLAKIISTSL